MHVHDQGELGQWVGGRCHHHSHFLKLDTKPQDSLNTRAADLKLTEDHNWIKTGRLHQGDD